MEFKWGRRDAHEYPSWKKSLIRNLIAFLFALSMLLLICAILHLNIFWFAVSPVIVVGLAFFSGRIYELRKLKNQRTS